MKKIKPYILYDDRCLFCMKTKSRIDWLDRKKKIEWIGISTIDVKEKQYKSLKIKGNELQEEMHLISNKAVYRGYFAFKELCKLLSLLRIVWLILMIPGVDAFGQKIYAFISHNRKKF